jgi:hypothetical protein
MENRSLPPEPPQTPPVTHHAGTKGGGKSPKRDLTDAERWFKGFNSAYRVRVGDHYETVIERSLPFTGS